MPRTFLDILNQKTHTLEMSLYEHPDQACATKVLSCLRSGGITDWESLLAHKCIELARLPGMGSKLLWWLRGVIRGEWRLLACGCPDVCTESRHILGQGMVLQKWAPRTKPHKALNTRSTVLSKLHNVNSSERALLGRVAVALQVCGITTLEELTGYDCTTLKERAGIGEWRMKQIKKILMYTDRRLLCGCPQECDRRNRNDTGTDKRNQ